MNLAKKIVLVTLLLYAVNSKAQAIFSERGYPEHFIAGTIIGGATSYFVFKKTDNKFTAWLAGAATAAAAGYLKEALDPSVFNRVRNPTDAVYTVLGGAFGASIVIPLKPKRSKKTPNIAAAFQ